MTTSTHPHDQLLTRLLEDSDRLRALREALTEYAATLDSRDRARDLMVMVSRVDALPIEDVRARLERWHERVWDANAAPSFITYAPHNYAPRWGLA